MDSIELEAEGRMSIVLIEYPCPLLRTESQSDSVRSHARPTVVLVHLFIYQLIFTWYVKYKLGTQTVRGLTTLLSRNIPRHSGQLLTHLYSTSPPFQIALTVRVTVQSYLALCSSIMSMSHE